MEYGQLINAHDTQSLMTRLIKSSSNIELITAYFTAPAFRWVDPACQFVKPRLVLRGSASDFLSGASSFDAIILALESDWIINFLLPLHAKIYAFDEDVIVGSGNLTAKGFNLLDESGNYEFNAVLKRNADISSSIRTIFQLSTNITLDIAYQMKAFIDSNRAQGSSQSVFAWPIELFPDKPRPLLIADFPSEPYELGVCPANEPWASAYMKLQAKDKNSATQIIRSSAAFLWFCKTLRRRNNEISFGGLSSDLHSDIVEDTRIYRRSIKQTLVNFLSYISALDFPEVEILKPNHTQIFKLKPEL